MAPRQAGAALWRSSVVQRVGPRGHAALVLVDHLAAAGAPPAAEPDADEADDHDVERAPPPAAAAATNNHNHNVAFSPVSVHAALALTAAGARGATRAQLLAFLGAPSAEGLADFGRRVADRVLADRSDAGGPRVLFGGGVWVDAACGGLTDAFRDVAAEAYKSEARTVSFTDEVSRLD